MRVYTREFDLEKLAREQDLEAKLKARLEVGVSGGENEVASIEVNWGEEIAPKAEISIRAYKEFSEAREKELFVMLPQALSLQGGIWKRNFGEYSGEFYWTTSREAPWQMGLTVRISIWQASKRGCEVKKIEKTMTTYESVCAPEVEGLA